MQRKCFYTMWIIPLQKQLAVDVIHNCDFKGGILNLKQFTFQSCETLIAVAKYAQLYYYCNLRMICYFIIFLTFLCFLPPVISFTNSIPSQYIQQNHHNKHNYNHSSYDTNNDVPFGTVIRYQSVANVAFSRIPINLCTAATTTKNFEVHNFCFLFSNAQQLLENARNYNFNLIIM